jgi:hypothetical protein
VTYYFLGGTEENQQRRATIIAGVRSKIQKVHPEYKSQSYTNFLGGGIVTVL